MEPLLGIDPDATVEVALRGASFTVGVLDAAAWERLNHRFGTVYRDAQRRAIAKLQTADDTSMQVMMEMASDSTFREESFKVWEEVTRQCVRGHRGLLKKGGLEVPFAAVAGKVSPETMRWYALLPGLVEQVFYAARSLHTLSDPEKKDLLPVSSPTGGSSTAETAPASPSSPGSTDASTRSIESSPATGGFSSAPVP